MYVERKKESVMKINKSVIFALLCVVFVSIVMSGQHSSTHKSNPTRGKNKVVTSTNESPIKVKTKSEIPSGPTKEELKAAEKARVEKEKQEIIKKKMNAFGNSNSNSKNTDTNGEGKAGQYDGNSKTGATSGAPWANVAGRTLECWEKPSSTKSGSIEVTVTVNPEGKVIDAKCRKGTGAAVADTKTRTECEKASLKCKFSVAKDETKVQKGTITWTFK